MDAWKEEQAGRMELFGNEKFRQLIANSPTLSADTPIEDKYTDAQVDAYREEINTLAKEKGLWMPAQSPAYTRTNSGSDSGSQTRTRRRMNDVSGGATSSTQEPQTHHAHHANEEYFEKLGRKNDSRSTDLPPSQGGKYTGFGSTPQPQTQTQSNTSSDNVPSIDELRDNPMQAVSKGWGFFSSALGGAASAVKGTVDDKLADPNLERDLQGYKNNISSYWSQGLSRASQYSSVANEWTRKELGIDMQKGTSGDGSTKTLIMVNDILHATENLGNYIENKESISKFNKMYIDIYTSYKAVGIRDRNLELELDRTRRAYLDKLSTELVTAFGIMSMARANELLFEALESLYAALSRFIKTSGVLGAGQGQGQQQDQVFKPQPLSQPHPQPHPQSHPHAQTKQPRKKLHKKKSDNWILVENTN
ncbi:hypothetical protein E3P98_02221 [Wallemia ichthyophaga]|nr:hypothetical protein E3P98_02221 [Wallemia ichthyophaga]